MALFQRNRAGRRGMIGEYEVRENLSSIDMAQACRGGCEK